MTSATPRADAPLVTLLWWDHEPHSVTFRTSNPLWKAHHRRLVDQGLQVKLHYSAEVLEILP